MIIIDLQDKTLSKAEAEMLMHPWVAGVIFFKRNIESYQQLKKLIAEVRAVRPDLLLAMDHEGGAVQRLKDGVTILPQMGTLGELYDKDPEAAIKHACELGRTAAKELSALDIDLSFAPVLDLNKAESTIIGKYNRGFHREPKIIVALATAFMEGMEAGGMACVGKHFPGHGTVVADSHAELPQDNRSYAELSDDLYPFEAMIKQGIPALMPAHILYPQIDKQYPVGFSTEWIKTIAREKLGFKGLMISDDLEMKGAYGIGDIGERTRTAIDAGCDLVLVCNHPSYSPPDVAQAALKAATDAFGDKPENTNWTRLRRKVPGTV